MGRATARCGRACATRGSAPHRRGFCGSCARTGCVRSHAEGQHTVPAPMTGPSSRTVSTKGQGMWGTDMTATLPGTGRQVAVLVAVDHCPAGCVGVHAATRGTRFEALQPIRQGVRECFGAIGTDVAAGLTIRHDNAARSTSATTSGTRLPGWERHPRHPCPRPRRERLCRALHPDAQGKSAPGQNLRDNRGTAEGPPGVQGRLQRALADPARWALITKPVQTRRHGQNPGRRVSFKSVSITLGRYNNYLRWSQRLELENASPRACLAIAIARPCIQFVN